VQLLGAAEDVEQVVQLLADVVIERSAPYPNRSDPGIRIYLTTVIPSAVASTEDI
jgi:hypothetical protein